MDATTKLVIDGILTAGFGIQHSVLATLRVKALAKRTTKIDSLAWRSIESIINILYIFCAALLWVPVNLIVWHLTGWPAIVMTTILVASWIWYWQIHIFEYDCGLAFGSTSFIARLASKSELKNPPWKVGSRRWIRFPVHTAFFPMFFCFPVMRADVFVLAIVLNIYNMIGSVLYDRRILTMSGDFYQKYINVTGLVLPNLRYLRGAADIQMTEPLQWKEPTAHIPALLLGIALGGFYWFVIGSPSRTLESFAVIVLAALAGSALVGIILGSLPVPGLYNDWNGIQTNMSTSVSISAAVGVITWGGIVWASTGELPLLAAPLPMWFIVQYIGHVVAYLVGGKKWARQSQSSERHFSSADDMFFHKEHKI